MNGVIATIIAMFLLMWGCAFCVTPNKTQRSYGSTVVSAGPASEGFDLKALPALVKNVSSAEELERKLNEPGGINNLDLDGDNRVDFIKVTEYGNKKDQFGFSLTAEPAKGEVQEIATVEILKDDSASQAHVRVAGNQQVYGPNTYYRSSFGLGEMLLLGYLLSPHTFYRPAWGYGYYPSYYRPYSMVGNNVYRDRGRNYYGYTRSGSSYRVNKVQPSNLRSTSINSPNAGKTASTGISRSLSNPTASQKSFRARSSSKSVGRGGFGRSGSVRGSSGRGFGGRGK